MTTRLHPRPFTGRRLALILCGMFAVVATVNFTMATLANKTFSGAVVANGYVANHDFAGWVERAREQQEIGWSATAQVRGGRLVVAALDKEGASLEGASVRVHFIHPFRASEARGVDLHEAAPGRYVAITDVYRGQWDANIRLEKNGEAVLLKQRLFVEDSPVLPGAAS